MPYLQAKRHGGGNDDCPSGAALDVNEQGFW
jgi:hypothetical protein